MAGTQSSDSEIVAGARGVYYLSANRAAEFQNRAREVKQNGFKFFRSDVGWLLRRITESQNFIFATNKPCALCGVNQIYSVLCEIPGSVYNNFR